MVGAGQVNSGGIAVAADSVGQYKIFVQAPLQPQEPRDIEFTLKDVTSGIDASYETMFITKRAR